MLALERSDTDSTVKLILCTVNTSTLETHNTTAVMNVKIDMCCFDVPQPYLSDTLGIWPVKKPDSNLLARNGGSRTWHQEGN